MKELNLAITHYKILHTVFSLNQLSLFPNQEGVHKVLTGNDRNEYEDIRNIPTFGTLISYSSKKICHYILSLIRHAFLKNVYDEGTQEFYLQITKKGEDVLNLFLAKRKTSYRKTTKPIKLSIIRLEK